MLTSRREGFSWMPAEDEGDGVRAGGLSLSGGGVGRPLQRSQREAPETQRKEGAGRFLPGECPWWLINKSSFFMVKTREPEVH